MRISQLSRYTFKVILTKQDMTRMDPEFCISDRNDDTTKKFISSLLDIIEKSMNTKISKRKLFVEIFEDTVGGCVVYICANESFESQDSASNDESFETVVSLNFEKLCDFSSSLKKIGLKDICSKLYYNKDYRLILQINKADERFNALSRLVTMYHGSSRTIDILFTKEHYKLLCSDNAVEKVLNII